MVGAILLGPIHSLGGLVMKGTTFCSGVCPLVCMPFSSSAATLQLNSIFTSEMLTEYCSFSPVLGVGDGILMEGRSTGIPSPLWTPASWKLSYV